MDQKVTEAIEQLREEGLWPDERLGDHFAAILKAEGGLTDWAYRVVHRAYEALRSDDDCIEELQTRAPDYSAWSDILDDAGYEVDERWHATHRIVTPNHSIRVMCTTETDGLAYSYGEWNAEDKADYVLCDGTWLFQGKPFKGEVEKL